MPENLHGSFADFEKKIQRETSSPAARISRAATENHRALLASARTGKDHKPGIVVLFLIVPGQDVILALKQ